MEGGAGAAETVFGHFSIFEAIGVSVHVDFSVFFYIFSPSYHKDSESILMWGCWDSKLAHKSAAETLELTVLERMSRIMSTWYFPFLHFRILRSSAFFSFQ